MFITACKFFRRDWRSGELTALFLALSVSVASMSSTSIFVDRLNRSTKLKAAEFLAADLLVTSHFPLPGNWLEKAERLNIKTASTAEFATVLIHGDKLLLCGIKAVTDAYPLRGSLTTVMGQNSKQLDTVEIPSFGTAWISPRVMQVLGLNLGDSIEVGERKLKLTRILKYEPDRRGNFLSLAPRVMINKLDLEATAAIQPGSHVHQYFLFAGTDATIKDFTAWLSPQLDPTQKILDVHENRPELGNAYSRAERYLGLSSVVVVMISGVAIAMASRRYSERHFSLTAILRCLGAQRYEIYKLFAYQMLILGFVAGSIGCLLGWLSQKLLIVYLHNLLPPNLADSSIFVVSIGLILGWVILAGFSLPPLLRQSQVSPLRVLRKDLDPIASNSLLVYGLGASVIFYLLLRFTQDLKLIGYFVGIATLSVVVLGGCVLILLRASQFIALFPRFSWRFAMKNLSRHLWSNVGQIVAFSVTIMAVLVILVIRTDLLQSWQNQLQDDAANHFALNIFPSKQKSLENWLDRKGIHASRFFPVVRGRLTAINKIDVHKIASHDSQGERAINRDLVLTDTVELPTGNKLVEGDWWQDGALNKVSVEQKLADNLNIHVGDILSFSVGSQSVEVSVSSIRSVKWDSMTPNFYMILSPGTLKTFPRTYLTSFYIPGDQGHLLNELVRQFPNITILQVDQILKQINSVLAQVSLAVEYMLVFSLIAGLAVLSAAVYASMDERIYSACLLRTFGASGSMIKESQGIEFGTLGFVSGFLAAITSEAILWTLYRMVFDLDYQFTWQIWIFAPVISAILIGIFGYGCTRKVIKQSPLVLLRELQ